MKNNKILGIDIGGSGIKGAIINTKTGEMLTPRFRIETPSPATPVSVAGVIHQIVKHFEWKGPLGAGYPGVVQKGIVKTAANVDSAWINTNIELLITRVTGCPSAVVNDADAAGLAEMKFGAGVGHKGVVLLLTVGTGIGVVMFSGGKLVPNLELGHIMLRGGDAEKYASDAARQRDHLSWEEWAVRFTEYLARMEDLLWPDLIIIGGGASKKEEFILKHVHARAKLVTAKMHNNAGIIGAAIAAKKKYSQPDETVKI
jgi:polyphosphate glucokinase